MKLTTLISILAITASSIMADEPAELARTRASYQTELTRATKPITDKYRGYLEAQKAAATKAGKLDVALAYDKELKSLSGDSVTEVSLTVGSSTPDDLKTALSGTMWTCTSGNLLSRWKIQLQQDGNISMTRSNGSPGWNAWTWHLDEKRQLFFNIPGSEKPNEVKLSKKLDRMTLSWGGTSVFERDDKK